ncbi:capping protein-inhibiting regulator of actin dynamics isoform X2 [Ochotona princeps]|uniref:capping protein-inhibiting regulator of actin dynamics isoform X2 n=1 Tax=Ochotona princeps TaxID=9978 RepID=UPI0027145548|nr:capping protein-inhibiting regulator of actin dynamics isoform X2 [Ochotona princeps]
MGTRAFSHDSIFIPDGGAESEQTFQAMSQDNILGKVKTLQHQLGKNIKFGQRPANALPVKKASSQEASSEEGPLGPKPMDTVARQDTVPLDTDSKAAPTPGSPGPQDPPEAGREMEEKMAPVKPSRPKRHLSSAGTIESVNLDAIPLAIACLDNSAAKHKLAVKPKNQRISRKHRRLAQDIPHEQGGLKSPPPQHQNGHLGGEQLPWPREEAEPQGSEEEKRHQEDYWRELEAKCRRQKAEAAEKRRLEEQRLQALERRLREEEEEEARVQEEGGDLGGERSRHLQEEAWKLEQLRQREELEAQRRQETERLRVQEEETRRLEQLRQEEELEAQRRQETERLRVQEEEARRLEQLRQEEELEVQRRQEAERLQEEEARRLEQLRQEEELEAQRRQEAERLQQEEARRLEQLRQEEKLEAQRRQEAERLQQEEARRLEQLRQEEELEAQRRQEAEKLQEEEARRLEQLRQEEELEAQRRQEAGREPEKEAVRPEKESPFQPEDSGDSGNAHRSDVEEKLGDPENPEPRRLSSEEPEFTDNQPGQSGHLRIQEGHEAEGVVGHQEEEEAVAPEKGRRVEELRWQEVDERQSMPRPYTFQVSSGGKQILFPKVNLSPVTPARDAPPAPRTLPAALSVPHTAILVTGAQLCGPAVNLSQIKDTACKSLLGLSEVKRHGDGAPTASPAGPPRSPSCSKARPAPEEHTGSGAALAEWATIRSRILRAAEGDREAARPRDEPPQGSLRRPTPPGAKFSIKPAWQKFSSGGGADGHKPGAEPEGVRRISAPGPREETAAAAALPEPRGSTEKPEPIDATEGCKFAKDLPSFLVPSPPRPAQRAVAAQAELAAAWDSEAAHPAGEDQASPFGIKLRRTNYSLRFHCEQQAEQKKKKRRSSAGDGAEAQGATGPSAAALVPDKAATRVKPVQAAPSPSQATPDPDKAASRMKPVQAAPSPAAPDPDKAATRVKPAQAVPSPSPVAPEPDKAATRMKPVQKPALAPKPAASQTPPPSPPRSKLSRPYLAELLGRRTGKPETEPRESIRESSRDPRPLPPPLEAPKREEEVNEVAERSPASPAAVQEKLTQTPEAGRREKPALEDRPSLEKGEAAQPLWVTLALQKQRGFREQQATREERKQAREAKQAAKLTREHVSGSPQSSSRGGSLHAATVENKPETAVARPERREPLRKASTLPTSVTVEISDSVAPAPLLKEVAKRFSTPDATPVATEPAWLALAKRKAKAWSDCPQIIK